MKAPDTSQKSLCTDNEMQSVHAWRLLRSRKASGTLLHIVEALRSFDAPKRVDAGVDAICKLLIATLKHLGSRSPARPYPASVLSQRHPNSQPHSCHCVSRLRPSTC